MKLTETFYTRTRYGLTKCPGKRINEDYAVVKPWFSQDGIKGKLATKNRYYVIHIKSGLGITNTSYSTIKAAIDNFESDLEYALDKIKEKGKDFDTMIQVAIKEFDKMIKNKEFYRKEDE